VAGLLAMLLVLPSGCSAQRGPGDRTAARKEMVTRQIKARGIKDQRVLTAMEKIPRHLFIPQEGQRHAYDDSPVPIGEGQTISQPYIVALMTDALKLKGSEKVLEIGTGSGYQAAVLAELAREVYTIEIVDVLAKRAGKTLKELGYKNVHVRSGDGYLGWPEAAPFDAIIITCAPERIPQPLINQLKDGGRLVVPVGPEGQTQELVLLEKAGGKANRTSLGPVIFVPMTGKAQERKP
jgi:protein-L-isoaspartate(D-aspartate) O-methyltransferase